MSTRRQLGGIGYVLRQFPVLSETFVLNEILALEALGERVHIFSLERPNDSRFHEGVPRLSRYSRSAATQSHLRKALK